MLPTHFVNQILQFSLTFESRFEFFVFRSLVTVTIASARSKSLTTIFNLKIKYINDLLPDPLILVQRAWEWWPPSMLLCCCSQILL